MTEPTAVVRTPYCHKIRYGVTGAPEIPIEVHNAPDITLAPTLVEIRYLARRGEQPAFIDATVRGYWMRAGERVQPEKETLHHFKNGPAGWPEWLAEEARFHDPDAELDQARRDSAHWQHELQLADTRIAELRDELAEEKALHDPRLRGLLVKAAPDRDLYVLWSNVCDMPAGAWTREEALAYGFPRSHLDQADKTGSSSRRGYGDWDDSGFVAEQRGWLKRDRLGDYALLWLGDRQDEAFDLLEPFEGETEVRR